MSIRHDNHNPGDASHRVTREESGGRLDHFVAARAGVSRRETWRLLDEGGVRVNGRSASLKEKGISLATGDHVELAHFVRADEAGVEPQPELPLSVLAGGGEGDDWLIVDKPAGMAVHPLKPGERGTLLNAVASRYPRVAAVGEGGLRGGVVHRLDVTTSGCVAFALCEPRWRALRHAVTGKGGWVLKRYHALVLGRLGEPGDPPQPMSRHLRVAQHKPARVAVVPEDAREPPRGTRPCSLTWRPLRHLRLWDARATLVEVDLHTGFLHQIRVMLADPGHPLLGDPLYGGDATLAPRPMLHAAELRLGDGVEATSAWPADFAAAVHRYEPRTE